MFPSLFLEEHWTDVKIHSVNVIICFILRKNYRNQSSGTIHRKIKSYKNGTYDSKITMWLNHTLPSHVLTVQWNHLKQLFS